MNDVAATFAEALMARWGMTPAEYGNLNPVLQGTAKKGAWERMCAVITDGAQSFYCLDYRIRQLEGNIKADVRYDQALEAALGIRR